MTLTSRTVVLSLPNVLTLRIEKMRKDLPRSLVYRRLLEKALEEQNE